MTSDRILHVSYAMASKVDNWLSWSSSMTVSALGPESFRSWNVSMVMVSIVFGSVSTDSRGSSLGVVDL